MRRLLPIFVSIVLCVFAAVAYAAEPRTGLVIGNAAYGTKPLSNPVNDATDIAAALRQSGFEVILKTDADQAGMTEAVRAFGAALQRKGGVGLFYFAGHGVQIGGDNYIIPVGVGLASENDVRTRTVNSADVLKAMAAARNPLNIVILDACRDNPFSSGERGTRGLARMESNSILFLSLSTSPGAVALDGNGRNSPYTKHLVRALDTPGLTIEDTFKRTLKGVYQETQGQQTPWISSSFFGEFVFRSGPAAATPVMPAVAPTAAPATPPATAPAPAPVIAGGYQLDWRVASSGYRGSGTLVGNLLTVDWGSSTPVIYALGPDGRLTGLWDAGRGEEILTPER
jgi:uncharacterized caspase-like protein